MQNFEEYISVNFMMYLYVCILCYQCAIQRWVLNEVVWAKTNEIIGDLATPY
jgi:hypothetical protein